MTEVMKYFPLATPRASQTGVIQAIDKLFKGGTRIVILEGPVGSGKSAIAQTLAAAMGSAHILTPRKSLQDQYIEDFRHLGMRSMKGKSSYPCIPAPSVAREAQDEYYEAMYQKASDVIASSGTWDMTGFVGVQAGDCILRGKTQPSIKAMCEGAVSAGEGEPTEYLRPCPFRMAVDTAISAPVTVHNLHSFLFQNYYGKYFEKRNLLVIDEAHELEGIVRDFVSTSFNIDYNLDDLPPNCPDEPAPDAEIDEWVEFLSFSKFVPSITSHEEANKKWTDKLEFLAEVADTFMKERVVFTEWDDHRGLTKITFMPENMGNAPANLFLQFGVKVLLMSGTIYDKDYFCRKLGLDGGAAAMIKLTSEFPLATRPIVANPKLMTDNSHKSWTGNDTAFGDMIRNMRTIMKTHVQEKGLIHAPSYHAAETIASYLGDPRIVTHTSENVAEVLAKFYESTDPLVLISPICQQGVDFKYDRARFQMVVRVPYLNTQDPFVGRMMKKNFSWYNYQSLVVFGQMMGRVNRAPDDYGVTYLLDKRFTGYLRNNRNLLPNWLLAAIKGKM